MDYLVLLSYTLYQTLSSFIVFEIIERVLMTEIFYLVFFIRDNFIKMWSIIIKSEFSCNFSVRYFIYQRNVQLLLVFFLMILFLLDIPGTILYSIILCKWITGLSLSDLRTDLFLKRYEIKICLYSEESVPIDISRKIVKWYYEYKIFSAKHVLLK